MLCVYGDLPDSIECCKPYITAHFTLNGLGYLVYMMWMLWVVLSGLVFGGENSEMANILGRRKHKSHFQLLQ